MDGYDPSLRHRDLPSSLVVLAIDNVQAVIEFLLEKGQYISIGGVHIKRRLSARKIMSGQDFFIFNHIIFNPVKVDSEED